MIIVVGHNANGTKYGPCPGIGTVPLRIATVPWPRIVVGQCGTCGKHLRLVTTTGDAI